MKFGTRIPRYFVKRTPSVEWSVEPILSNVNLIVKFSFNRDDGIVVVPEL